MRAKGERRLELLSRKLAEAGKCVAREDAVQASEKLYKAAEEAVKELAFGFELSKSKEAQAWFLHVEGFHEARLEIEEVKVRVGSVRELVSVVEK